MLSEISIRNVVLIEALDLELRAGLTAMTGETGAGKSIILDALGMATGARSDKGLVRRGADKASCSARFVLPSDHIVWSLLEDAGLEADSSQDLVLRRVLTAEGRSRAYINDEPAGQKLLAKIGSHVLEVHGQHDGRGLLDSGTHRGLLDRFGGFADMLTKCSQAYGQMKQAQERVTYLEDKQAKSDDDRAFYDHAISELDRLAPRAGEDEKLASERRLLQHGEGALSELASAQQALGEDGAYEARIGQALAGLERVRNKIGEPTSEPSETGDNEENGSAAGLALETASGALEKALIELEEARGAVNAAAQMFDFEPGRLNEVEERLFSLRAVARKYDVDVNGLADLRQKFGDELLSLERSDEDMLAAQKALGTTRAAYDVIANKLTQARRKSAKILDAKVLHELPALRMQNAQFTTQISMTPESANGRDAVIFEVSTNPGTPSGPLNKIASGGELSRFALAIKVALAGKNQMVMVFDEIDQGVGGAVADAVGRRLSALAETGQVLVVTHSPQVAASADHQLLIHKTSRAGKTITNIEALDTTAREEEIARMLAGESITDAARAAARQLMQAL
ncbi:MAG: DNA repair protein RecN [Robiginitomaculum sp.]|nr:MAG: DNA repair protein RecN [Robiginitomaculum sp.]